MANLLIVDDEPGMRQLLTHVFGRGAGHAVRAAENGAKALELLRQEPADLIISDVKMRDMGGIELLRSARALLPDVAVVLMTAFATVETAREAFKLGADDFIQKPFDVDELKLIVEKALERLRLLQENRAFRRAQRERGRLDQIIGHSQKMQAVYQMIETVAQVQSTVLITGESGTGKEMVARAIHNLSPRADKPFVPVNCGAFTETLLESELFGYVRGAFTGAAADRKGLWEEADGGTLFLDEIGETSQAMQVKLLRALQEGEIRRVGSTRPVIVDARVLSATNRDLEREVKSVRFREDLFYRLGVVTLRVPPLRERRSDIPLLAERFLRAASENAGRGRLRLSEGALNRIVAYDWPGNVRELESAVEYAALHARGAEVAAEDLPAKLQSAEVRQAASRSPLAALYEDLPSLDELERRYLQHVLEATGGNRTRTAEILRIDRRTLYRMAERFRIRLDEEQ